jgi:hypothetical protein
MSKSTTLSTGPINQSGDTLTVELVETNDHPPLVRIVWPAKTTFIQPSKFAAVAAEVTRLIAAAVTKHNQIKAGKRL